MSNLREFLQTRERELTAQILPIRKEIAQMQETLASLEEELAEIQKSAEAIGMVNGVRTQRAAKAPTKEGTIKDYAVQVLADAPNGLVALDILARINERFGTDYPRTSLSPQLSRLKNEGRIARRGVVWFLVGEKEKGPEDSGPHVGGVAERSIASDSKSEEPPKLAGDRGSVGSNPTTSAKFHRVKDDLLTGVSFLGANSTPKFQIGKKGV